MIFTTTFECSKALIGRYFFKDRAYLNTLNSRHPMNFHGISKIAGKFQTVSEMIVKNPQMVSVHNRLGFGIV